MLESGCLQPPHLCFGKPQVSECDPLSVRVRAGWGQAMISEWPFLTLFGIYLDDPFPHTDPTGRLYITSSKSAILHRQLWFR